MCATPYFTAFSTPVTFSHVSTSYFFVSRFISISQHSNCKLADWLDYNTIKDRKKTIDILKEAMLSTENEQSGIFC